MDRLPGTKSGFDGTDEHVRGADILVCRNLSAGNRLLFGPRHRQECLCHRARIKKAPGIRRVPGGLRTPRCIRERLDAGAAASCRGQDSMASSASEIYRRVRRPPCRRGQAAVRRDRWQASRSPGADSSLNRLCNLRGKSRDKVQEASERTCLSRQRVTTFPRR
jgi:hypothetical protein